MLYSRNQHNILKQLYSNKFFKLKKKKEEGLTDMMDQLKRKMQPSQKILKADRLKKIQHLGLKNCARCSGNTGSRWASHKRRQLWWGGCRGLEIVQDNRREGHSRQKEELVQKPCLFQYT